ncbi:MAG TPA: chitobiase/beta-hexosaminidase C-terminal domain-containing protein [Pyrinomonadaceae bacterium]|nr:chitobiase/beta-hexosaminidase C-terminal domain-containing protein [Pyrinomonadaceae bacterium]
MNKAILKQTARVPRVLPATVAAYALLFAGAILLRAPVPAASAQAVNEPPAAPHSIIVFPERDFVTVEGYDPADGTVRIEVVRNGVVVSSAAGVPDKVGFLEVNHPGGLCWENVTPNIRPGDIVRTTQNGVVDQTRTANVTAGPAVDMGGGTIVIHGTALDAAGNRLPEDQIEQRMVASSATPFALSGRRTLRADFVSTAGGLPTQDGLITWDAPGSANWTATYTGLSAADVTLALQSESRGYWLGSDPAALTELTIFEVGDVANGPQSPCVAPSEDGSPGGSPGPVPPAPAYDQLFDPPQVIIDEDGLPEVQSIVVFPERDFVSLEGFHANSMTINVLRNGVTVGAALNVTPDIAGVFEVNHPGAACWVGQTPDIRPGDVVRATYTFTDPVTFQTSVIAEQTTVANVTAERPIDMGGGTVIVHGTAQDAAGNPLPIGQVEQRLVNGGDRFDFNGGRRTLRANSVGADDGTLAYDAPGSVNWTATYTNLGAADVRRAMEAESRGYWLGRDPAALNELTIFELGADVVGGPATPSCTAPPEPTVTVTASERSGVYAEGPNVYLVPSDPLAEVFYTLDGSQPTTLSTRFAAPISIPAGTTRLRFFASVPGGLRSQFVSETYVAATPAPPPNPLNAPDLIAEHDTGVSATDNVTRNPRPVFVGSAAPLNIVELYATGGPFSTSTLAGRTRASSGGAYMILPAVLLDGDYSLAVKTYPVGGAPGAATPPLAVTIDTIAVTPSSAFLDPSSDTGTQGDGITNDTTPAVRGTAEPGVQLDLYFDGLQWGSGAAGPDGQYVLVSNQPLTAGLHTAYVVSSDVAGNVSNPTPLISITVDTTAAASNITPQGGSSFTGPFNVAISTESGATIRYTLNGPNPTATTGTLYTGLINISATTVLRFVTVDRAGNVSAVRTETYTLAPPAAPSALSVSNPSAGLVQLVWTDNSNNESGFEVWRSTSATTGFVLVRTVAANTLTTTDGVPKGTYYYRMRAKNGFGFSAYTTTVGITVKR